MYFIIYATSDRGICTRFVIGCADMADALACDLTEHGFTVVKANAEVPPLRAHVETDRVRRILATLQPRLGVPQ